MNLALAQMDYPTVLNGRILIVKKFGGRFWGRDQIDFPLEPLREERFFFCQKVEDGRKASISSASWGKATHLLEVRES